LIKVPNIFLKSHTISDVGLQLDGSSLVIIGLQHLGPQFADWRG